MMKTYAESFWGGDLSSCAGYDILVKRNHDSKKMCLELEEYLKKRSKAEADYSKSLQGLTKSFRQRDEVGVLESALNKFRSETERVAQYHNEAAAFFQHQADCVKKFKENQAFRRKAVEDSLNKSQQSKLTQLSKTLQLEKSYFTKFTDRDAAEQKYKEISTQQLLQKEVEKARKSATKAKEDAEKADSSYRSAVKVLESCRVYWEKEMTSACESIQALDEERINFLRQELWIAVNMHSKVALDIDTSCESVRVVLENCDIDSDIQAFIQVAKTGQDHPEPYLFKHYTKMSSGTNGNVEDDRGYDPYSTVDDLGITGGEAGASISVMKQMKKKGSLS